MDGSSSLITVCQYALSLISLPPTLPFLSPFSHQIHSMGGSSLAGQEQTYCGMPLTTDDPPHPPPSPPPLQRIQYSRDYKQKYTNFMAQLRPRVSSVLLLDSSINYLYPLPHSTPYPTCLSFHSAALTYWRTPSTRSALSRTSSTSSLVSGSAFEERQAWTMGACPGM